MRPNRGNALIETIVALLALAPFIGGMVLLGKQLDVKHKTYDAVRYSVWERTVWSRAKSSNDLTVEALDRAFGHPLTGLSATDALHANGVSQNPLWVERGRRLLSDLPNGTHSDTTPPVQIGYAFVPALAHGDGPLAAVASFMQLHDLELNARAFSTARLTTNIRPLLADRPIAGG